MSRRGKIPWNKGIKTGDQLTDDGRQRIVESTSKHWADPEWAAEQAKSIRARPGQKKRGYETNKYSGESHWNAGRPAHNRKEPIVRECMAQGCAEIISTPPSLTRIRFCSTSCQAKTTNRRSDTSLYDWGDDPYGGDWPQVRLEIRTRDNNTCKNCNHRGGRLEVHHLCYDRSCRDRAHLVTLCPTCHQGGHRRGHWPITLGNAAS